MENKPRNIVLQLGALITLYLSVTFLLTLVFGLVNLLYPDPLEDFWQINTASESVRFAIAMLVVFFPTYLVLTKYVNKFRRTDAESEYQNVTKWLLYLSLLIGGLVLLSTLVTVLYTFLNGEFTTRFLLKASAVVLVVGAALHYYILDARGVWVAKKKASVMYGVAVSTVVTLIVVTGFMTIESPAEVREQTTDAVQISDLTRMQWDIIAYYNNSSSTLPSDLGALLAENFDLPNAPTGREAYSYEKTERGFRLCATFARDSVNDEFALSQFDDPSVPITNADDWRYKAGRHCFERVLK
jgi:Domain of unknown function (DUF5671)